MEYTTKEKGDGANRRQFLQAGTFVAAARIFEGKSVASEFVQSAIKAVAFDAFALFDVRPVFRLAEEIFPGHGAALSDQWRTRQFEYTWLRNLMRRYTDFWQVTQDALNYAAKQTGVTLHPEESMRLMSAYLELKPWPDVAAVVRTLRERGVRLGILSNMTAAMMQACVNGSGLKTEFEFQLSTDRVKAFKPDPAAYQMGLDAFQLQKQDVAFVAFGAWDAAGGKAFGYPTYWANRLNVPPEELGMSADVTSSDLSALVSFIDSRLRA